MQNVGLDEVQAGIKNARRNINNLRYADDTTLRYADDTTLMAESERREWLTVSGFMVMGLVSGLSLANRSDSESFLVVHALFCQDGCQRGFWEVVRHVMSPSDLS